MTRNERVVLEITKTLVLSFRDTLPKAWAQWVHQVALAEGAAGVERALRVGFTESYNALCQRPERPRVSRRTNGPRVN